MIPAAAGVRSAAEKLGIGYAYATFQQLMLPSPHQPPLMYPGRPLPPERADAKSINSMFCEVLNTHRASIGLASVDDVRDYVRRRTVVARGWADLTLTDDADDCIGVGEVNQQALFARVAAVVHHGGAGTTTTTAAARARASTPQLVIPQAADQPYWAGRVAELGIGAAHDGPTPTIESLSDALETALSAETRGRASAVAATIRADGARDAA